MKARAFAFRMFDPYVINESRKRPRHVRLASVLRQAQVRAAFAGARRGPRLRRFVRLSPDMLDARRCGIDPRFFRGAL